MARGRSRLIRQLTGSLIVAIMLVGLLSTQRAVAATSLGRRYDKLSTPVAGASARHELGLTMTDTTQAVGSLVFEFCSNTSIIGDVCNTPSGFDITGATLLSQTGDTGFSIHPSTTANKLILTRVASNPTGVPSTYTMDGVINPTNSGSNYVRMQSFGSLDGSGIDIQNGGVVFHIDAEVTINSEVPPYIRFCVGITITSFDCSTAEAFFIDFGFFQTTSASRASSQFLAATNAESGYSVSVSGTTLVSGSHFIPELTSPTGSVPGVSQFGINLRSNSNPSVGGEVVGPGTAVAQTGYNSVNQFSYNNGDIIASVTHADDNRKFTVSYLTNISSSQEAGVYATTISFICLANF